MRLGFAVPVSGSWATPANQVEVARLAEDRRYASLWTFQRLLYSAEGEPWAPVYAAVHDPLVTLAHVAGVTSRVRLGVAVLNMPFYSPILMAKQLTTLDVLSGGRLVAGLGLGWSREEFAAVGVPYERRGARGEEFLHALEAIWRDDVVEFKGEFYDVPRAHVDPKPVQRPRPPILLGGFAPAALDRAARLADGWVSGSAADFARIESAITTINDAAAAAGRDASTLEFVVRGVVRLRDRDEERLLSGTLDKIRGDLDRLAAIGVTETFVDLNFDEQIGRPDADAGGAMDTARSLLGMLDP